MALSNSQNQMLASTAHWIAAVRANESEREDRLFDDPWAAALAGKVGLTWLEQRSADSIIPIVLRTRFFDDFLLRIVSEKKIRQVVLMGAGMDTRAFRLALPDHVQFYELDQIPVLEYKRRILSEREAKPTCKRHPIGIDLNSAWEPILEQEGFENNQPSVWLMEGFLFYLSNVNITNLFERAMSLTASGSFFGFDMINSLTLTSPLTKKWVDMQAESGAPWIGSMDEPVKFFMDYNWNVTLIPVGAPEANYDRWPYPVIPAIMPEMPHLWFVIAEKQ